jgi:hypothetical protein
MSRDSKAIVILVLALLVTYAIVMLISRREKRVAQKLPLSAFQAFDVYQALAIALYCPAGIGSWIFVVVWRSCSSPTQLQSNALQFGVVALCLYIVYWGPLAILVGGISGFLRIPLSQPRVCWAVFLLIIIFGGMLTGWNTTSLGTSHDSCIMF